MEQNTSTVQTIDIFTNIATDYSVWFAQIVRFAFYPDVRSDIPPFPPLIETVREIKEYIPYAVSRENLKQAQNTLHEAAVKITSSPEAPPVQDFDMLWQAYDYFSSQLQYLEKNSLVSDFGFDLETGLRSSSVMMEELAKELERRSRRGQPFSVAILRIDDPDLRQDSPTILVTAKAIQKTIRSFDDAYICSDGEFVVSLKHSDTKGGVRFVSRFNEALKDEIGSDFTVTACVGEPLPGDELDHLLTNIRDDLDHLSGIGRGVTGEYEEVSPLNKFLQSMKEQELNEKK